MEPGSNPPQIAGLSGPFEPLPNDTTNPDHGPDTGALLQFRPRTTTPHTDPHTAPDTSTTTNAGTEADASKGQTPTDPNLPQTARPEIPPHRTMPPRPSDNATTNPRSRAWRTRPLPNDERLISRPPRTPEPAQPPEQATPGLQIRILGPLEITGTRQDLQPKQTEIVLLLALHTPTGLRNDQLRTMLSPNPDQPKRNDWLRQAITRTRRRLGTTPNGQEHIQHIGDGTYRLHDTQLDWTHFQTLTQHAIHQGQHGATGLRQALDLVRGRPLEGCYWWWIDTPLLETIRATIVDTAEHLAELELTAHNPAAAGRATRKGLTADPAAEQLWRMLMRAEYATGNTVGVHDAWTNCLHKLTTIDTDLEPHPDTTALYRTLTGKPTTTAAGVVSVDRCPIPRLAVVCPVPLSCPLSGALIWDEES